MSRFLTARRGGQRHRGENPHYWHDTGRKRSDATINRYLDCLRKCLRMAYERRDGARCRLLADLPEIPKLKEGEALPQPIADLDISTIIEREEAPWYVAFGAAPIALTGMRKAEVFGLGRVAIDWQNCGVRLSPDDTKGGRGEFVRRNEAAMTSSSISIRKRPPGAFHGSFRICPPGRDKSRRRIKNRKRAWATACKAAGLTGRHRIHDLKASFVTAIGRIAPAHVTQALARHVDDSTPKRYLAIVDKDKRAAVDSIANTPVGRSALQRIGKSPTRL